MIADIISTVSTSNKEYKKLPVGFSSTVLNISSENRFLLQQWLIILCHNKVCFKSFESFCPIILPPLPYCLPIVIINFYPYIFTPFILG